MKKALALILIVSLSLQGCAVYGKNSGSIVTNKTLSEELAIGEKIHREILASFHVYTKPDIVEYVKQVGLSITEHAGRQELPYRFTVLYNDKIYATSAPGGYVYVTTGMINFLESEAELAAVLAHEVGQLQYVDPRVSQVRKVVSDLTRAGAAVGPFFGPIGALAVFGLVAVNVVVDQEPKKPEDRLVVADQLALDYLMASGYDPEALLIVFDRFLHADQQTLPYFYDYYQSRPISEVRFITMQNHFSKLPLMDKELITNPKTYQDIMKPIREIFRS